MRKWTAEKGISCFYFEAFDEIWKDAPNPGGSENHFGLFTIDGKAKYALWDLVDDGVFKGLGRGKSPITKTYNGNKDSLLLEVHVPPFKKNNTTYIKIYSEMKLTRIYFFLTLIFMSVFSCTSEKSLSVNVIETSKNGNKLSQVRSFTEASEVSFIRINPEKKYQKITGFGGSFTEASAYLLNKLSAKNRDTILNAYFSKEGANYSLTRTHMNSCDFSLSNYSYAPVENDIELEHFSIQEDKDDLIPMIKDAMMISEDGFNIIASPWTAAPWMKDNNKWVGGKLLPKYYDTWALFFSKYLTAYKVEGIDIWGVTVENEPHGNGNNWESMHYTPKEMTDFVQTHLGPKLEEDGYGDKIILGYDQNRADIKEWVDEMYKDDASSKYFDGTAIHWYESTYDFFPEALQYAHNKAPNKYLIETEGFIDSEVPK